VSLEKLKNDILIDSNTCIIIPTYNNEKTVERIIKSVIEVTQSNSIIVVNDGSTDQTSAIINQFGNQITVLEYSKNKGKGFALKTGFKYAIEKGFKNAISIDSDGQHFPADIPLLLEEASKHENTVIMGSRNMEQEGVPGKSSFGNKFSNFWFWVETSNRLPDTQTGFRLYPLEPISKMKLYTNKFELEIELIVRLAWKGVKFKAVSINVHYDFQDRVTHFRPFKDFTRISILNTIFVIICFLYIYPRAIFSKKTLQLIKLEATKKDETNLMKSLSLGFGAFIAIFPVWGFQLLIGIPLATAFKMNRVLFLITANISIPPLIPAILYVSIIIGQLLFTGHIDNSDIWNTSFEAIQTNLLHYTVGAIIFSLIAFGTITLISLGLFNSFRKNPK
jgi:glycosyltransferase involved in cell wall biosynthesis